MAHRSGLGAQVGIRKEDTYGTYKAPSRFLPFTGETLSYEQQYVKSKGLVAGRMAQRKNLHRATTGSGGGDLNFELFDQGMGAIFDLFHGDTVTPTKVEETEGAYKQVHPIGLTPPWGKSATVQAGRPDTGGVVRAFSYLGCKAITMKIGIEASGIATFALTLDAKDEDTTQTLAEATYDADALPYTFQQMAVMLGGEALANVLSMSVEVTVPQKVDRYFLGNTGRKAQPIANEQVTINGNATLEFASMADHDRYKKEEVAELVLGTTGDEIDSEQPFEANLKLKAAKQVSSAPQVSGPDVLTTDVTFEGLDDGTGAPLSVEIVSSDSAL